MKSIDNIVAYLLIKYKDGNEYHLYHSWHEIEIDEIGIKLTPNCIAKELNWSDIEFIRVVNRLEIELHNEKIIREAINGKNTGS
jgi:hypothetical protein